MARPDPNVFAGLWLRLLAFHRRRPSTPRGLPAACRGPLPITAADCLHSWGQVLRELGWCRVHFEPVAEDCVAAVLTPRTRWDHDHRQHFTLSEGSPGIVDRVLHHHLDQLLRDREVFTALDAADSPLDLMTPRDPATGRGRQHHGLLLVSAAARRQVLGRLTAGERAFEVSARVAPSSPVTLPFEGVGHGFGVASRVQVERAGRRVVVRGNVVDHRFSAATRHPSG